MSFEAHLIRPHGHLPLEGKARGWERQVPKAKGQTATAQIEDLRRGTEGADEVNSRQPNKFQFIMQTEQQ